MVGVLDPEDVARELDDRVLKSSSGPDEREATLARVTNRSERSIHAAVGAGGCDEKPGVPAEPRRHVVAHRVGGRPLDLQANMSEGLVRGDVCRVPGVEVAHYADESPRAHLVNLRV
jgi:hypothetical protein